MDIKREVNESVLLMNEVDYKKNHDLYRSIDKMQVFGGDNLKELLDTLEIKGKNVYTVCGSGDQPLEFITRDFSCVDTFDINLLARHILNLKITAILYLSYENFMFFMKGLFKWDKFYSIIEEKLPLETQKYFKMLFNLKGKIEVYNDLFTHKCVFGPSLLEIVKRNFSFYNQEEFYLLKEKLTKVIPIFRTQNLFSSVFLDKKYDVMYFSNILLFSNYEYLTYFKETLLPIYLEHLRKGGTLIVHYAHLFLIPQTDNLLMDKKAQKRNEIILETLGNDFQKIPLSSSGFGRGTGTKDMALILKK